MKTFPKFDEFVNESNELMNEAKTRRFQGNLGYWDGVGEYPYKKLTATSPKFSELAETVYALGEKMLKGKWKEDLSEDVETIIGAVHSYKKYLMDKTSAAQIYQLWEDFSKLEKTKGYAAAASIVDKSRKRLVIALNDVLSAIVESATGTDGNRRPFNQ